MGASFRDVAVVKELPMAEPKAGEVLIQVSRACMVWARVGTRASTCVSPRAPALRL